MRESGLFCFVLHIPCLASARSPKECYFSALLNPHLLAL